jgi:hypothetical protein
LGFEDEGEVLLDEALWIEGLRNCFLPCKKARGQLHFGFFSSVFLFILHS